ncbi:MAG: hypothetical protein ACRCZH_02275 [Cetobacterium sp.]
MALNTQQEAWIGIYGRLPNNVNRFFTRRISKGKIPFVTNAQTIVYEEIKKHAHKAKILQRGEEFPTAKLNGSIVKSVTPEVLKDSVPFFAEDTLNKQPGQQIYVNGVKVDNASYERDRRIGSLKTSIVTTTEEISSSVFLEGKYKSADTGNTVEYTAYPTEEVTKADIKDWAIWTTQRTNDFLKTNKAKVDEILVGEDVFYAIIENYNKPSNKIIPATPKRVLTEDGDFELQVEMFGNVYTMIPPATNALGESIDTANWVMFINNLAHLPAYAGVVNVQGGKATMEAIDVLIRETSPDEKTGGQETLAESAYCPIVVNPNLIKIYKVTEL